MRFFEIQTPDGRIVRHQAEQNPTNLTPGYVVTGEFVAAYPDGNGLSFSPPLPDVDPAGKKVTGYSLMGALLARFGDELGQWLDARAAAAAPKKAAAKAEAKTIEPAAAD
ncbi:MAG TPA: hypothetical protein VFA12_20300 [Stellaceae bacterium]|nr:hypothetical protein [Stellaceae bacterium]